MKPKNAALLLGVALAITLNPASAVRAQNDSRYQSASVMEASDIAYPPESRSPGMVTLEVTLDRSGVVQKMSALRDQPPLTKSAEDSVRRWKFSPATKGAQPVPGGTRVNVVFNPFNPGDVSIPNKPLAAPVIPEGTKDAEAFRPADVKAARYAVYPANTVASGTVVLDVQVGQDGRVRDVKVLHGVQALSAASVKAIKDWQFFPATYGGKPVDSHEVVAFVFVPPEIGTM